MRRCPSRSFTVTGDLDQRSGAVRAESWQALLGPAMRAWVAEEILTVSYRTPASVLDRANDLMTELGIPAHYPLVAARDLEDAYAKTMIEPGALDALGDVVAQEDALLDDRVGKGRGRIAIIASADDIDALQSEFSWGTTLDDRVAAMTPLQAKGLEFDTVILWEPMNILDISPGDLYVSMTRPTTRLHTVSSRDLPQALQ